MTYRILVTGSRDWPDENFIRDKFKEHILWKHIPVTLVSGACPTGADRMAEKFFEELQELWGYGFKIERWPAEWDKYGKRAGFLRNAEMVKSNPDLCLAFIYHESKGASMTWNMWTKTGREGYVYTEADL